MNNVVALLFLLLPVAAFSGWVLGRRRSERTSGARVSELSTSYFRGLNYLLNEQQDKAIEVFLKLAEINRDTVETHLALGNLFRRRGEVDRAIRVHQNLIARPNLSQEEKTVALLELGEDYMRAGLLDRAETLFADLVAMDALAPSALRHLIAIYQHERDWDKAIEHAQRLERATGEPQSAMIAQFHCELADQARAQGARDDARRHVDDAFAVEPECVRASMILGQISTTLSIVFSLATLLPSIAVATRRLHDTDRSGWWQLISFVPIVGIIVLIVFLAQDSRPNRYGAAPAYAV